MQAALSEIDHAAHLDLVPAPCSAPLQTIATRFLVAMAILIINTNLY